jgi:hypothetical protein
VWCRHLRTPLLQRSSLQIRRPGYRVRLRQALLVDHTGTHRINPHEASAMADAIDDGVELYFASALPYAPA